MKSLGLPMRFSASARTDLADGCLEPDEQVAGCIGWIVTEEAFYFCQVTVKC